MKTLANTVAAFIVLIVSVAVASYFAILFANISLPSVADRNGIGAFMFIVIPLVYVLHHVSKRVVKYVSK